MLRDWGTSHSRLGTLHRRRTDHGSAQRGRGRSGARGYHRCPERDRVKTIFEEAGAEDIASTEEARVSATRAHTGRRARVGRSQGSHMRRS